MHFSVKLKRMTIAALLGALFALVATIAAVYISFGVFELILSALCAYSMTLIAFGAGMAENLKSTAAYLAVNISLGGLMTALFSFLSKISMQLGIDNSEQPDSSSPVAFILIAGISAAVSLIYGKMKERSFTRKKVAAKLTAFDTESTFTLLSDSGNLLTDPFTKKPVIVLSAKCMESRLPADITEAALTKNLHCESFSNSKLRIIPASSVTGSSMLIGFIPSEIQIEGKPIDAIIALDSVSEGYDGCEGIISQTLLNT